MIGGLRLHRLAAAVAAAVVAVLAGTVWAADAPVPSVDEIVRRTNFAAYYQGRDGRADVTMTIRDAAGAERKREFAILRRDQQKADEPDAAFAGEQKLYVYFQRPADVNKMAYLVHKHPGGDDDRWLYLPALDLVKRIAAGDKRTSFVGSTFFYEDVSGRSTDLDRHELLETTANYYVLRNTPKDPASVEFSSFTMWVHRSTFLPVKIEYADREGRPYRAYEALKVETIQDLPTVTKARMKDLSRGGETVLEYTKVEYNIGLPEDIFTERYLRNPPRQYLR